MSSILMEAGTPCPRRPRASNDSGESDPLDRLWDETRGNYDDTRNINFTTEIRAPVLGAKPKRRARTTTSFAIHSDPDEKHVQPKRETKQAGGIAPSNRKSSLLAQPAQRFRPRPRVSFAPSPLRHSLASQQSDEDEPKKRRARPVAQRNNDLLKRISGSDKALAINELKGLQRTAYLPSEDTTAASVFMGIFSPLRTDRVPLQPSSKIAQETCDKVDIPGRNGGKENMPPGMEFTGVKQKALNDESLSGKLSHLTLSDNKASKPLAARSVNKPARKVDSKPAVVKGSVSNVVTGAGGRTLTARTKSPATSSTSLNSLKGSRPGVGNCARNNLDHEYPLASASITNLAMYDDNWLSHQEAILAQLIDGIISHADSGYLDTANLRNELLLLYQGPYFTNLYKRLQASLLYGALSIPRDVLLKNSRLQQDLGMKRRFIDIFIKSYEPNALRSALEAVTGRVIPAPKTSSNSLTQSANGSTVHEKALTKRLARCLDTFLIQNQDVDRSETELGGVGEGALADAYRRTVLRSMMIIILLDKARISPKTSLSGCLFLTSSPYKSSFAVLQASARFLLPSCGDVGKALSQLDCQLSYEQHPLEEYNYTTSNLAVDLRDGVRLTRLVESLLYPSSFSHSNSDYQWPLSLRLKVPCLSRVVKMSNARIALEALASTEEGRQLVTNVRAADIVDGHREKTIALLWGLVSNWGLSGLIDLDDLKKEIDRLRKEAGLCYGPGDLTDEFAKNDDTTPLLRQWASLIAQLRGLRPENLTMNLANGKVYECILDEYEEYISAETTSTEDRAPLQNRLLALGCSPQFINLIFGSKPQLLDAPSTTGALAFFCSRLLPTAKQARAAATIQNAWRRVLGRRDAKKRAMARDVARQCAAVVQTRDRILWAKSVIVHWWRLNRSKRRNRRITVPSMKTTMAMTRRQSRIPARDRKSTKIPLRCLR
ncbi:hypothetical protein BDW74DRAFT_176114 [Aspergillus multicolor]|uniref:putative calmodulin-binding protein Sha1 n=1 Tax=Aspergillus multicolor TaxID=41759 RepID=UPI003CCD4FE0